MEPCAIANESDKPFRIGIWCMVETTAGPITILPTEGIGVFVHNLVGGLMALPEVVEVALVVHPRDQEQVTAYHCRHGSRVRVLSRPKENPPVRQRLGKYLDAWVSRSDRAYGRLHSWRTRRASMRGRIREAATQALRPVLIQASRGRLPALAVLALVVPWLFLAAWCTGAAVGLGAALVRALILPLLWLDRVVRRAHASPRFQAPPPVPADLDATPAELVRVSEEAECAMWVLPSLLCNHPVKLPSIQFIHDLVTYHFPDYFDPSFVAKIAELAPVRAGQALLIACMSAFIRDHDLLGELELSPAKVRMVPSATPVDLPVMSDVEAAALLPATLSRKYLFYPTAFRPHKNIPGLIKALRRLRDRHGVGDLDLVLTGHMPNVLLPEHQRLVQAYGLEGHVHVVGQVDRRQLAALYRGAFATLVPSLYEQASYQIAEALQAGCPVACARIPPFLEQCRPLGKAMLYFDPLDAGAIARAVLTIRDDRDAMIRRQERASRALWQRTWKQVAAEWLRVFKETAEIAAWPKEYRERTVRQPWPTEPVAPPGGQDPLEVFLFLQHPYLGGVWETTKELVQALLVINRQRQELRFTLGVQEEQADVDALRAISGDVTIERMKFEVLTHAEAARMFSGRPEQYGIRPEQVYCFWSACARTALRADAWLALCDRFHNALLPARPYGVVVYDMIQRHVPQVFSSTFFVWRDRGMMPTLRGARVVMTTSRATRADVMAEYGLEASRLHLIPVACEPHRRFGGLSPKHVPLPARPFILYAANTSEHKGAGVMLRAFGRLKERLGDEAPMLVVCGGFTDRFSPSYQPPPDEVHWRNMRTLVRDLELEEGRDVVFLGFVNDAQLLDLYQRCAVVVNAARHDNGSYCLIEGHYFGRPVISSRYPGAEDLCERFQVPAKFFPVEDAAVLAELLAQAVKEPPLTEAEQEQVRERLAAPEFSSQRYAERVYDMLLQLAKEGRRERLPANRLDNAA
jgi:glycosyltransferase involved in cell wall biosynthesis